MTAENKETMSKTKKNKDIGSLFSFLALYSPGLLCMRHLVFQ